jgi:F-type H+-transporting ATPase subunit g
MGKIVARGQKMSPPYVFPFLRNCCSTGSGRPANSLPNSSVASIQTYYQNLWRSVQNGSILSAPQNLLNQARNLSTAQLATGGVVLAECIGFFTVGEMIGRMKIVGYHGETASHH